MTKKRRALNAAFKAQVAASLSTAFNRDVGAKEAFIQENLGSISLLI